MRTLSLQSLWAIVFVVAAGCGEKRPSEIPKPSSSKVESKTFTMRGVVRKVDRASLDVTIAHEAMPGFMGAMTMPFVVERGEWLDDVQPGDEVEGPISVEFEGDRVKSYRLRGLEVTNPAPVSMKLEVGKDGAKLSQRLPLLNPGDPVPDFLMTTQEGKTQRLSDLKGKVVVLTFIYTRCPLPDFCPATDRAFNDLSRSLGALPERAEGVRLLSVSFDPEHDTPKVLEAHAKKMGATPPLWSFAVASHDELRKVAEPLGLTYGPTKDEIIHDLSTAVIGPDGRLVRLERGKAGSGWTAEGLAKVVIERMRVSKK